MATQGPKRITSYKIRSRTAGYNQTPKDFTLQGSNNDVDWDVVDTVVGSSGWGAGETREFAIDSPAGYRYYKVDVTAVDGGT